MAIKIINSICYVCIFLMEMAIEIELYDIDLKILVGFFSGNKHFEFEGNIIPTKIAKIPIIRGVFLVNFEANFR